MIGGRAEPLAALYPREASAPLERGLRNLNTSLQPLISDLIECARLQPVEITGKARVFYRNVNHVADLELV